MKIKFGQLLLLLSSIFLICFSVHLIIGSEEQQHSFSSADHGTNLQSVSNTSQMSQLTKEQYAKIEKQTVFDENGLSVTLSNLKDNKSIDYCFTNNTDKDMHFYIAGIAVNGCMTHDFMYITKATPGNSLRGTYDFHDLDMYGIQDIETLDICFYIKEDATFINGAYVKTITTDSTKSQTFSVQNYPKVYEDEKVAVYYVDKGSDFEKKNMVYCNKTSDVIYCWISDAAVNGIMFSTGIWDSREIAPNCLYYTAVGDGTTTWSSPLLVDLEKVEGEIKKITGKVSVYDGMLTNYYDMWTESDNITILDE